MDIYQGSAYRTDRAREQARAFKQPPPAGGFLGPGVPVDVPVKPPGGSPPAIVPVMGGGGAASAAIPIVGVAVAAVGAFMLSRSIKADIDRFKRDARLPFYDDLAVMNDKDWAEAKPGFDLAADLAYQQHVDGLIREYAATHQPVTDWLYRSGFVWRFYKRSGNTFGPHNNGRFTSFIGFIDRTAENPFNDYAGWSQEWNYPATIDGPTTAHGAANPTCSNGGTGICALPMPPDNQTYAEWWIDPTTTIQTSPGTWQSELTQGNRWRKAQWSLTAPLAEPQLRPGHGRSANPWRDAVAPPGSQPSLEQQEASERLPSGSPREGYYVLPALNYPFTWITTAPGSPPVTVPDVVIEPGVGVTIVPPSPPDYGNPDETRERKVRHKFSGAMFINIATESQDFLEAMHKGLPKKLRSKHRKGIIPEPDIILRDIWDNWDDWDAQKAIEAFINNQIEDALLGKFYFGAISKAKRRSRRYRDKKSGRLRTARGLRWAGTGGGAGYIPVPQIHFTDGRQDITVGDAVIEWSPSSLEKAYGVSEKVNTQNLPPSWWEGP